MSHTTPLRHRLHNRLGAAVLATGLGAGLALTAQPAEAMISEVCISWTSSGYSYIDSKGNDIYVVQARCSMWMTTGGEGGGTEGGTQDPEIPKGPSPSGEETKEEHCAFLKGELAEQRAALAWATGGIQAADDELDKQNFKSSVDHAAYVAAHEEYQRALAVLEEVKARYAEENDTSLEYETRNGNTVVVQLAVDPRRPWGEEVVEAQAQLDRARAAERKAWDAWSQVSDPAARAAQQLFDQMNDILATAPMHIENLQRELAEDC